MTIEITTMADKHAFWKDQLPAFEKNYWLPNLFEFLKFDMDQGNYVLKNVNTSFNAEQFEDSAFDNEAQHAYELVNTAWSMWIKAVSHMNKKLEGCVVVPVEMPDSFNDATTDYFNDISEGENYDAFVKLVDIDNKSIWAMAVEAARGGNE
ncbi:hypothetical protein [Acinetobacter sp. 99]|uniref:hypothetical protein n=1 Tax=Acinetobacter sp. 99 TaxID=3098765 RepID=UPI00300BA343